MMGYYEGAAMSENAKLGAPQPLLAEIETHLTTVQHIATRVGAFIERVNNGPSGPECCDEQCRPSGYASALKSLGSELQRLDKLSRELEAIG